jgi:hypothetical protein
MVAQYKMFHPRSKKKSWKPCRTQLFRTFSPFFLRNIEKT